MIMKLNRFLFFPPLSPPFTTTTLGHDAIFSLLETRVTLGVLGGRTIAGLILVGALFFLSLFFFPGPTLIFIRWFAVAVFYTCVCLFYLLYIICRWLFIALVATCRCLFDHSHSVISELRVHHRPLLPERVVSRGRSSMTPENRSAYPVPPRKWPDYGTMQPENHCGCGPSRGESKTNSDGDRSYGSTDREKMKQTYEYRRAMEAEWAARQRELQRQAAEARRQRGKRAENKSAKANEGRQKQRRTDEQKPQTSRGRKDNENLDLKEKYREDIRKKLSKLEKCVDMCSLLRSLGIHITPQPSPNEVRSAYKKACLKFHPDRLATADLRHQIEAEEKFKLISAMKDKFSS